MTDIYPCPECGKPMAEQKKFRGLWVCPDGLTAVNDIPPFQYICRGMKLTDEGAAALHGELMRLHILRN